MTTRRGVRLTDEIPIKGLLSDREFLLKDGAVGTVLVTKPKDPESMEKEDTADVVNRLAKSLRLLEERFVAYQYLLRRSGHSETVVETGNRIMDAARRDRAEMLRGLYHNETYVVIVRLCGQDDTQPSLLPARTYWRVGSHLAERQNDLAIYVDSWLEHVSDFWPMRIATKAEAFGLMWKLLNYDSEPPALIGDDDLDDQLSGSDLLFRDPEGNGRNYLQVGERHAGVLSLKQLAKSFPLHYSLERLCNLEADFNLCIQTQAMPMDAQKTSVKRAKGSQAGQEQSMSAAARAEKTKQQAPDRMLNQGAVSNVEELAFGQRQLEAGNYLGCYSLTVAVHAATGAERDRSAERVKAAMNALGCRMHREGILNKKAAFFSMLPGGYRSAFRTLKMLNSNVARLSLVFGVDQGNPYSEHLRRESLITLETREKTPYCFNFHEGDVGHVLILGKTGGGKSFLVNALVAAAQKYKPYTSITDLGGSFEHLTKMFGGTYTRVTMESKDVRMNPFAWPASREQFDFLTLLISSLMEQRGERLPAEDVDDIFQAVTKAYDGGTRRLGALKLPEHLSRKLRRWVSPGQYSWLLDNEEDTVHDSEFQTHDFLGMEKHEDLLEPLFMCKFQRDTVRVTDPARIGQLKLCGFDEGWVFVRNPRAADYIEKAFKTHRRYNSVVFLSTQSGSDLSKTSIWQVLNECCTKLFLWNPAMDEAWYQSTFGLRPKATAAIRGIVPKRELFHSGSGKVLSLRVSPREFWMYANSAPEIKARTEAIKSDAENWLEHLVSGAGRNGNGVRESGNGENGGNGRRYGGNGVHALPDDDRHRFEAE